MVIGRNLSGIAPVPVAREQPDHGTAMSQEGRAFESARQWNDGVVIRAIFHKIAADLPRTDAPLPERERPGSREA